MWELLLTWLPVFGWILGGTMLLSGIIAGLHRSLYRVLGNSNARLFGNITRKEIFDLRDFYDEMGTLSDCLLSGGLMCVGVGLGWVVLVHYGYLSQATLMYGLSLGGIIGIGYSGVRRRIWNADTPAYWHLIVWGAVGALLGGIVSGFENEMMGQAEYILNEERRIWWVSGILFTLGNGSGIRKMMTRNSLSLQFLVDGFMGGCAGMFGNMLVIGLCGDLLNNLTVEPESGLHTGVLTGVTCAMTLIIVGIMVYPLAMGVAQLVSVAITPFVILLGAKPILCPHCLRYTKPRQPEFYKNGTRCCEHCHTWTEWWIHTPGKVIFTFGNFSEADLKKLQPEGQRVIVQTNPTFGHVQADTQNALFLASRFHLDHNEHPVDVSEVYIDTATCDPWRIDRFITYILNHPPKHGVRSVKIFYRGGLDELGTNLNNALHNNFSSVKPMS